MQRVLAICLTALIAGCTCGEPFVGFDARALTPDASMDVGRDAPIDAYASPDASITELALEEFDPTPCAPVALPPRNRMLPVDATPRVLWTRSLDELGVEGVFYDRGAIDRTGDLHFSTLLFELRGGEISRDGALLGFGDGSDRTEGPLGLMTILPNDRAAEWSDSIVRIDESPPSTSPQTIYWPHDGNPRIETTGIGMAATSDGLYAYRGYGGGRLRKYCADGRLQWELSGVPSRNLQVDEEDSVWIRGTDAAGATSVRVDRDGRVIEREDGYVEFADTSRWIHSLNADGRTLIYRRVVDGVEVDRIVSDRPVFPDPFGGAWVAVGPSTVDWVHRVGGVDVGRLTASLSGAPVGEDGSFLVREISASDEYSLIRVLPTGEVAWRLSVPPFGFITHDIDGRVYLYGGHQIIAVQTDVLPPNVRGCWQHRCNALANMSIAPYPG